MAGSKRHVGAALVTAIATAAALALTGCNAVDAGSAAEAEFAEAFADVDGIASIDVSGSNDLPFVGSVTATVVADEGLADVQVDELAGKLAGYAEAHDSISWRMTLDAQPLRVGIDENDSRNELHLAIARELLGAEHVVSASVGVPLGDEVVRVVVDDPSALHAGHTLASAAVDRLAPTSGRTNAVAEAPGPIVADDESYGGEDVDIERVLAPYDALVSRFTLIEAELTPEKFSARVASEDDVDPARELVTTQLAASDVEISIQGGKTTRLDTATPAAAAVGEAMRSIDAVTGISIGDDRVVVTVGSIAEARPVLTSAGRVPQFADLRRFDFLIEDPDGSGSLDSIFAAPADISAALSLAEAAAALPGFEGVSVDDRFELRLDDASEETIAAFVAALKPQLASGRWPVWINADGQVGTFDAASTIARDDSNADRDDRQQAFADMIVRVWNAG